MASATNAAELLQAYDDATRNLLDVSMREGADTPAAMVAYEARAIQRDNVLTLLWAGMEAMEEAF